MKETGEASAGLDAIGIKIAKREKGESPATLCSDNHPKKINRFVMASRRVRFFQLLLKHPLLQICCFFPSKMKPLLCLPYGSTVVNFVK